MGAAHTHIEPVHEYKLIQIMIVDIVNSHIHTWYIRSHYNYIAILIQKVDVEFIGLQF